MDQLLENVAHVLESGDGNAVRTAVSELLSQKPQDPGTIWELACLAWHVCLASCCGLTLQTLHQSARAMYEAQCETVDRSQQIQVYLKFAEQAGARHDFITEWMMMKARQLSTGHSNAMIAAQILVASLRVAVRLRQLSLQANLTAQLMSTLQAPGITTSQRLQLATSAAQALVEQALCCGELPAAAAGQPPSGRAGEGQAGNQPATGGQQQAGRECAALLRQADDILSRALEESGSGGADSEQKAREVQMQARRLLVCCFISMGLGPEAEAVATQCWSAAQSHADLDSQEAWDAWLLLIQATVATKDVVRAARIVAHTAQQDAPRCPIVALQAALLIIIRAMIRLEISSSSAADGRDESAAQQVQMVLTHVREALMATVQLHGDLVAAPVIAAVICELLQARPSRPPAPMPPAGLVGAVVTAPVSGVDGSTAAAGGWCGHALSLLAVPCLMRAISGSAVPGCRADCHTALRTAAVEGYTSRRYAEARSLLAAACLLADASQEAAAMRLMACCDMAVGDLTQARQRLALAEQQDPGASSTCLLGIRLAIAAHQWQEASSLMQRLPGLPTFHVGHLQAVYQEAARHWSVGAHQPGIVAPSADAHTTLTHPVSTEMEAKVPQGKQGVDGPAMVLSAAAAAAAAQLSLEAMVAYQQHIQQTSPADAAAAASTLPPTQACQQLIQAACHHMRHCAGCGTVAKCKAEAGQGLDPTARQLAAGAERWGALRPPCSADETVEDGLRNMLEWIPTGVQCCAHGVDLQAVRFLCASSFRLGWWALQEGRWTLCHTALQAYLRLHEHLHTTGSNKEDGTDGLEDQVSARCCAAYALLQQALDSSSNRVTNQKAQPAPKHSGQHTEAQSASQMLTEAYQLLQPQAAADGRGSNPSDIISSMHEPGRRSGAGQARHASAPGVGVRQPVWLRVVGFLQLRALLMGGREEAYAALLQDMCADGTKDPSLQRDLAVLMALCSTHHPQCKPQAGQSMACITAGHLVHCALKQPEEPHAWSIQALTLLFRHASSEASQIKVCAMAASLADAWARAATQRATDGQQRAFNPMGALPERLHTNSQQAAYAPAQQPAVLRAEHEGVIAHGVLPVAVKGPQESATTQAVVPVAIEQQGRHVQGLIHELRSWLARQRCNGVARHVLASGIGEVAGRDTGVVLRDAGGAWAEGLEDLDQPYTGLLLKIFKTYKPQQTD